MDPWENVALQSVSGLAQLGLQFGGQYANAWLARGNAEAQLELMQRYQATLPPPPTLNVPLLIILVVGVIVIAKA